MLPTEYAWLALEPGPKMVKEALKLYGVHETPGPANNPIIMAWCEEIAALSPVKASGVSAYKDDSSQAWCGLFMAVVAKRAGEDFPDHPLWAMNWCGFGRSSPMAMLGDVLVFERRDEKGNLIGGHVGLYAGEDEGAFHVLGGNERDAVSIMRMERGRLKAARRPLYKIQPVNVRQIILKPDGVLSSNEA